MAGKRAQDRPGQVRMGVVSASRPAPVLPTALAPALAIVIVVGLDLVLGVQEWPLAATALLDESAHLLTAWLALTALAAAGLRAPVTRIWPWAMLGAVAIDIDHLPLYLWNGLVSASGGRPVTHSLVTVVALLAVAAAVRRFRWPLLGLGLGVLLHFLRDVATGPGLPVAWPVTAAHRLLPYWLYILALCSLAAVATVRSKAPTSARRSTAAPVGPQ